MNPIEITRKIREVSISNGYTAATLKFILLVYYDQYNEAVVMEEGHMADEPKRQTKILSNLLLEEVVACNIIKRGMEYEPVIGHKITAYAMKWTGGFVVLGGLENKAESILSDALKSLNINFR